MNYYDAITEGISVPLTKLASGYKPKGLIGTQVFPVVTHPVGHGQIPIFSSKDAFRIYYTERAKGAHSNRAPINPDSWLPFACVEHDIAIPMDQTELDTLKNLPGDMALKALFNLENRQRRRAQWNLALGLEHTIAGYLQNTANYSSDQHVTLADADAWSEADSDPVTLIEAGREIIRKKIGLYPNTAIMGVETYGTLKFHPTYTAIMNTTKDKVVTLDLLKQVHQLDKVFVGASPGLTATGENTDIWGDFFCLAYIPETETPDIDEPSFGYTIRPTFSPKPYPYVDIFTEEGGKIVNVRCTDNYTVVMVMKECGYLIKNTKK